MSKWNVKAAARLQNHPGTLGAQGINSTGSGKSRAGSVGSSTNDSISAVSDNSEFGSNKSYSSLLYIISPHLEHPVPGLYGSRTGRQRRGAQQQQHLLCQPVALFSETDRTAQQVREQKSRGNTEVTTAWTLHSATAGSNQVTAVYEIQWQWSSYLTSLTQCVKWKNNSSYLTSLWW